MEPTPQVTRAPAARDPAPPAHDTTFTDLSRGELAARLGSAARALAARRWLLGCRPAPPEVLPERIPGVTPAAWKSLRDDAPLPAWRLAARETAADGTVKLALELGGPPRPARIEAVMIPGRGRSTICLSSQAGCTRHCAFCATATLGFTRQLSAGEMVLQYIAAQATAPPGRPARNVVFMGMGEPLDNLDQVLVAIERLTEDGAPQLGHSHVTVSTSGVAPGMRRFLRESKAQLALSLNATTDEQRERLMPHNRQWPIAALLDLLRDDARAGSGRRYLIEYVLWDGENDTDEDAVRLAELLRGLDVQVNLIPHNAFEESPLRPPSRARLARFKALATGAGLRSIVRWPRGGDIAAACGQLALRPAPRA